MYNSYANIEQLDYLTKCIFSCNNQYGNFKVIRVINKLATILEEIV